MWKLSSRIYKKTPVKYTECFIRTLQGKITARFLIKSEQYRVYYQSRIANLKKGINLSPEKPQRCCIRKQPTQTRCDESK
jgi:hypothetical protein